MDYYSIYRNKIIKHFLDYLDLIQNKNIDQIPDSIYNKINNELIKNNYNIQQLNFIDSYKIIQNIMKNLYLYTYDMRIYYITCKIKNIHSLLLDDDTVEYLKKCMNLILNIYNNINEKPTFLSYSFLLHKLLQLKNNNEYPLLIFNEQLLLSHNKFWNEIKDYLILNV